MTARAAAITFVVVAVLSGVGLVLARSDDSTPEDGQASESLPPQAPVRGCRGRIEGPRTITPQRGDTVLATLALSALPATYRDLASRPESWRPAPPYGMPVIKVIAVLRAGTRVTLVVPREQRPWMKLLYTRRERAGAHTVTLQACKRLASGPALRRECRWRPYRACRSRYTNFSGGFALDFATARRRGLCAELIVWVEGTGQPLRKRLFHPSAAECAESLA
jgi:hypothetical protein